MINDQLLALVVEKVKVVAAKHELRHAVIQNTSENMHKHNIV